MTSEVSICNMALSRAGVNQTIASLSDQTTLADGCSLWYGQCRDEILRMYPWTFAMRSVALAAVAGDPPPGWLYHYRYPSDCLRIYAVMTTDGLRSTVGVATIETMLAVQQYIPRPVPFSLMSDDSGRLVVTDLEDAYVLYTKKITDPNQFDPLFISMLSWRITMELVVWLGAADRIAARAERGYAFAVSQAAAAVGNEQQPDIPQESPSIQVR